MSWDATIFLGDDEIDGPSAAADLTHSQLFKDLSTGDKPGEKQVCGKVNEVIEKRRLDAPLRLAGRLWVHEYDNFLYRRYRLDLLDLYQQAQGSERFTEGETFPPTPHA